MSALPVLIWVKQGNRASGWPFFAWILFFSLPMFGILVLIFGVAASDSKIDSKIYIPASGGGLFMAILTFPVFLILKKFKRKK
jgi:hypothetical protein